ncbi:MAG: nuclear transport factor 2 family protein, partial [Myxococcota bacterium]
ADALPALLADHMDTVHHPTGAVFGREGNLDGLRMLLGAENLVFELDALATLGEALVLCHYAVSARGVSHAQADIGPFGSEEILLIEVDEQGRSRRIEFFASEHLSDAVVRLYERYAEILPDGRARARASAIAHSVGTLLQPAADFDSLTAVQDPAIEFVDHRTLGAGILRGGPALVDAMRSYFDMVSDTSSRCDEVLGLRPEALLIRWTNAGTLRDGGGTCERCFINLCVFSADGLLARGEWFDADADDAALARFEALSVAGWVGSGAGGTFEIPHHYDLEQLDAGRACYAELTSATGEAAPDRRAALTRVFCDAFAGRDWDALAALLAPDLIVNDHRLLGWEPLRGPAAYIEALKTLVELAPDVRLRIDHLTTSGPRFLYATTWLGTREGGPFESPSAIVCELDAMGRIYRFDQHELDQLDDLRAQ